MIALSLHLAGRNLTRHRARTAISLSAIAFGVVALLLAGGFIEWIFWAIRESAIQTGLGHIQISRPGFRDAGLADPYAFLLESDAAVLDTVAKAPGVEAVDQRLAVSGLASSGERTVAFLGEAVDPTADRTISKVLPVKGRNLSVDDPTGVLLGSGLAEALGIKQGDRVSFVTSIPGGGISAVEGHVVGLLSTGVKASDDSAVRIPIALGRELLKVQGSHTWTVGLTDTDQTDQAVAYLRSALPAQRYEIVSWFDLSDFYRKSVVLLSRQVYFVAFLIGLIIVLGIANTLTMSVLERTGEIGTMMAMGTRRGEIMRLFILEGLLLGLFGAATGLVVGWLLAQVLSYFGIPMPPPPGRTDSYSAKILLTWALVFTGLALPVVATMLASIYPAWRASRLPIVDALRDNR